MKPPEMEYVAQQYLSDRIQEELARRSPLLILPGVDINAPQTGFVATKHKGRYVGDTPYDIAMEVEQRPTERDGWYAIPWINIETGSREKVGIHALAHDEKDKQRYDRYLFYTYFSETPVLVDMVRSPGRIFPQIQLYSIVHPGANHKEDLDVLLADLRNIQILG